MVAMLFVAIATPNWEDRFSKPVKEPITHFRSYRLFHFPVDFCCRLCICEWAKITGDRKAEDEGPAYLKIPRSYPPVFAKNSTTYGKSRCELRLLRLRNWSNGLLFGLFEQFGAIFVLSEQPGTGKQDCIKTAQYVQLPPPCARVALLARIKCDMLKSYPESFHQAAATLWRKLALRAS